MGIFISLEIKVKDSNKEEDREIPFGGTPKDILIDFKCKKCGYEEKVPDFVAFECCSKEDFDKESGSPIPTFGKKHEFLTKIRVFAFVTVGITQFSIRF